MAHPNICKLAAMPTHMLSRNLFGPLLRWGLSQSCLCRLCIKPFSPKFQIALTWNYRATVLQSAVSCKSEKPRSFFNLLGGRGMGLCELLCRRNNCSTWHAKCTSNQKYHSDGITHFDRTCWCNGPPKHLQACCDAHPYVEQKPFWTTAALRSFPKLSLQALYQAFLSKVSNRSDLELQSYCTAKCCLLQIRKTQKFLQPPPSAARTSPDCKAGISSAETGIFSHSANSSIVPKGFEATP